MSARPGLPPLHPGAAPTRPHCTCMTGLTPAQLALAKLHGGLDVVLWQVIEAQHAVTGPAPIGDPALLEQLVKVQFDLTRASGLCLNHAFPNNRSAT